MKIIVTAGGSGGHIYPALAIINKFKETHKDLEILYIGTTNRMEKDIIPNLNINYIGLEIQGIRRNLSLYNIQSVIKFLKAIKKCKKIMKEFKPDYVIGTGGYVTAPVIYAGKKAKAKTFIHEQNKNFGLANKIVLKYSDLIFTSFLTTTHKKYKNKIIHTGNPTSEAYYKTKPAKKSDYNIDKNKKIILMVMGSQGSESINDKMKPILKKINNKSYEFIYVTGPKFFKKFPKYKNIKTYPSINNMGSLLKITDLIITRAGASTISEIAVLGIPSIIIPSMYVTDNHQYENALELVNNNCALLLEEKNLTEENLLNKIDYILNSKEKYQEIKDNISKIGIKDSATQIYKNIVNKE